ncbi:MAG: hypothetical protein OWT28_00460 [Firmicutes bacterium]|nr:hypothetical protein [Bacillota bacterium]
MISKADLARFTKELGDFDARHGAAVFLILFALIGLDIMSIKDPKAQMAATAAWLPWGIVFILVGFFLVGPEQDALAIARFQVAGQAGKSGVHGCSRNPA